MSFFLLDASQAKTDKGKFYISLAATGQIAMLGPEFEWLKMLKLFSGLVDRRFSSNEEKLMIG